MAKDEKDLPISSHYSVLECMNGPLGGTISQGALSFAL